MRQRSKEINKRQPQANVKVRTEGEDECVEVITMVLTVALLS